MTSGHRVIRGVVAGVPAAMGVLWWRAGLDAFTTVKATAAVLAALAVAAALVLDLSGGQGGGGRGGDGRGGGGRGDRRVSVRRPIRVTGHRLAAVLAVLAVLLAAAVVVAALAAPSPLRAVVGEAGRHSGVAVWTAALVLAVGAAVTVAVDDGRLLAVAVVTAVLPVAGYALVQAAGADPLDWTRVEGGPQVFSLLGNADHLSAWLGMLVPVAAATAIDRNVGPELRAVAVLAAVVGFGAAVASGSLQGPVAGLVGTAVVVAVWATDEPWRRRSRSVAGATAVGLVAVVVLLGVVDLAGSPAELGAQVERSLERRQPLWSAAATMAAAEPATGVGPGHFVDHWFSARPAAEATAVAGAARPVDDAHALVLQVGATAGVPAALLVIALVGTIAVAAAVSLARGGRRTPPEGVATTGSARTEGADRVRWGGFLGATVAAVVVTTVSVDTPPVTVTAAVVVGATAGPLLGTIRTREGEDGPRPEAVRPAGVSRDGARTGLAAVAGVSVALVVLVPLLADLAAGGAADAAARGDTAVAVRRWGQAGALATWERRYPARRSATLVAAGDRAAALDAQREAVARAPRNRGVLVDLARLTAVVEGPRAAMDAYTRAVAVDPWSPWLLAEAGRTALAAGRPVRAVGLLQRAHAAAPDSEGIAALLDRARRAASTG